MDHLKSAKLEIFNLYLFLGKIVFNRLGGQSMALGGPMPIVFDIINLKTIENYFTQEKI